MMRKAFIGAMVSSFFSALENGPLLDILPAQRSPVEFSRSSTYRGKVGKYTGEKLREIRAAQGGVVNAKKVQAREKGR